MRGTLSVSPLPCSGLTSPYHKRIFHFTNGGRQPFSGHAANDQGDMHMRRILFGFTAGFFATLLFHQAAVFGLWQAHIAPFGAFNMHPTQPFGIPAVLSLAFWGGIWGILFAFIHKAFPAGGGYWLAAFLFGAIAPSLVALIVVMPMKGLPMGGGWHAPLLLTAFLINGAWGVGTGLILRLTGAYK